MSSHKTWEKAHAAAVELARACKHETSIRKVREFGQTCFQVALVSKSDPDYFKAEIVRPSDPV